MPAAQLLEKRAQRLNLSIEARGAFPARPDHEFKKGPEAQASDPRRAMRKMVMNTVPAGRVSLGIQNSQGDTVPAGRPAKLRDSESLVLLFPDGAKLFCTYAITAEGLESPVVSPVRSSPAARFIQSRCPGDIMDQPPFRCLSALFRFLLKIFFLMDSLSIHRKPKSKNRRFCNILKIIPLNVHRLISVTYEFLGGTCTLLKYIQTIYSEYY